MASVLQLVRRLEERPGLPAMPGVRLRHFAGPADIPVWLAIRQGAFARQQVGVRNWDEADFRSEFLQKPWWDPQGIWFAEVGSEDRDAEPDAYRAVGTIGLAWRGAPLN